MTPTDRPVDIPGNLSPRATRDLFSILDESQERWGMHVTMQTAARLITRCRDVDMGAAIGHTRRDVPSTAPRLFLNKRPFVIVYNPVTRVVLRILHQARDLPKLLR